MVSKSDIAGVLSKYLQDLFDLPAEKITLGARLFDDLDLDSIDFVTGDTDALTQGGGSGGAKDLVVKLQEYTGRKISPSEFKSVRTIGDIVDRIYAKVNQ